MPSFPVLQGDGPEASPHRPQRVPSRTEPQLPIAVTHKVLAFLAFFTSLLSLSMSSPGVISQINYRHQSPCFRVCFWGTHSQTHAHPTTTPPPKGIHASSSCSLVSILELLQAEFLSLEPLKGKDKLLVTSVSPSPDTLSPHINGQEVFVE